MAAGALGMATAVVAFDAVAVAAAIADVGVVDGIGRRPTSSQLDIAGPTIRATRSAPTGRLSVSVVHQMLSVTKSLGFAARCAIGYSSLQNRAVCNSPAMCGG